MANRYWVGGTGTWDTTSTTNWAATSGGASGASVPTSTDNVIIDTNSGSASITVSGTVTCANLDFSAAPVNWTSATGQINVSGSFASYSTSGFNGNNLTVSFVATTTGHTISCPGTNGFGGSVIFDGAGGGWTLLSDLYRVANGSYGVTHSRGTLSLDSFIVRTQSFTSASGITRTLAFGTGKIQIVGTSGVLDTNPANGLTVTGTKRVEVVGLGSGAGAITITTSGTEAQTLSLYVTSGIAGDSLLASGSYLDFDLTGFSGTLLGTGRTIYGNFTISSGCTLNTTVTATTLAATSGPKTVTTNGKSLQFPLTLDGVGGTWVLQDALTLGYTATLGARTLALTNGTLDTNGFTVTAGAVSSSNSNVRSLTGGGTFVLLGAGSSVWNCATSTNLTLGAVNVSLTATTAKTFNGGGLTYTSLTNSGTGALTIALANTFGSFTSTGAGYSILFPTGGYNTTFTGTVTISDCAISSDVAGTQHSLVKTTGTVTVNGGTITDSAASGGATWTAVNSTNGGNNTGWTFTTTNSGAMLVFF